MIPTVLSSLLYVKGRRAMELFPPRLRNLWRDWELRVMVIVSLVLQIVLILYGNRRKYSNRIWVRIALWCAYLMADWVATVALGVISNNLGDIVDQIGEGGTLDADDNNNAELTAFWAPFLLLHLGGPDTITAYAMEDNELWLRHLLGLGVQAGVALYIFLMAWTGSWLCVLSVPIFFAGIIKYGERTWVLRSASDEKFRDSMLSPADPGPNYSKFMQEYTLKQLEGFHVTTADEVMEAQVPAVNLSNVQNYSIPDATELLTAHELLHVFKRLFVELILGFDDRQKSQSVFKGISMEKAFKVVEIELGFVYDMLYTKATVIYSLQGCFLRFISFACTFAVLVFFSLADHHKHPNVDLVITYLLLIVAVFLEVYAMFLLISSDWTDHWLIKHSGTYIRRAITFLRLPKKNTRWSNSMAQFNALSFYLKLNKPTFSYGVQKLLCLDKVLEKHRYTKYQQVSMDLRQLIYDHLKEKFEQLMLAPSMAATDIRTLRTCRGGRVLETYNCSDQLDWSIKVDFDQSILIWHIATYLCYYKDHTEIPDSILPRCKLSKRVSQYMIYLLVMRPFMLPVGIGMIRFRDTQAELTKFFEEHKSVSDSNHIQSHSSDHKLVNFFFSWARNKSKLDKSQACNMLLKVNAAVPSVKVKGDRSKSVLFDACRLASGLQALSDKSKKWQMISEVWVEMLGYAASQCRGYYHAQQLRRGGELLSHVWLLMAHFGLTEQFQISQGHARVKLVVK